MDNGRKITIAILVALTVLLIGAAVYIVIRLNNSSNPDSSVFGFGDEAVRDFYDDVEDLFQKTSCQKLFDPLLAISISQATNVKLTTDNFTPWIGGKDPTYGFPKFCAVQESITPNKYFELTMNTYRIDSNVYESEEEKIALVVPNFINSIYDEGEFADVKTKYFFGLYNDDPEKCGTIILDDTNEFHYILLTWTGYDCSSQEAITKNQIFSRTIGSFVYNQIKVIYDANGFDPDQAN